MRGVGAVRGRATRGRRTSGAGARGRGAAPRVWRCRSETCAASARRAKGSPDLLSVRLRQAQGDVRSEGPAVGRKGRPRRRRAPAVPTNGPRGRPAARRRPGSEAAAVGCARRVLACPVDQAPARQACFDQHWGVGLRRGTWRRLSRRDWDVSIVERASQKGSIVWAKCAWLSKGWFWIGRPVTARLAKLCRAGCSLFRQQSDGSFEVSALYCLSFCGEKGIQAGQ